MIKCMIVYGLVLFFEGFTTFSAVVRNVQPSINKRVELAGIAISYILEIGLGLVFLYFISGLGTWWFALALFMLLWLRDAIVSFLVTELSVHMYRNYQKQQMRKYE